MLQAKADVRIVAEIAGTEEIAGIVRRIEARVRVAMIVAAPVVPDPNAATVVAPVDPVARRVVMVTARPVVPVQVVLLKIADPGPKVRRVALGPTDLRAARAAMTTTAARAVTILARATGISMIVRACPRAGL